MLPIETSLPDAGATYDAVPYPSSTFRQTHPNRLAAQARLFGIAAKSPSTARILELGCSDGGNLIPMAAMMPRAKFLGIDASKLQIAAGRKVVSATKLKNIELRQQNILDFPAEEGQFDYIIVHGVYSWVPGPVRAKILAIAATHLSPNGVVYISYNALPGSSIRMLVRDMAFFHTRGTADPKVKAVQARELLRQMSEAMSGGDKPYQALIRQELEHIEKSPEFYFRHDLMEEINQAFYFHEFVAAAAGHGLQYLSEPNLWQMMPTGLGPKAQVLLGKCTHILDLEQQMDFLRFRPFRQTLLCRAATPVNRQVTAKAIPQFAFQAHFRGPTEAVDFSPAVSSRFTGEDGSHFTTVHPFVKSALQTLSETPGCAISYTELVEKARERLPEDKRPPEETRRDEIALMNDLMQLLRMGWIEIYAERLGPVKVDIKRPRASAFTRYQAMNSAHVTNWVHEGVALDVLARHITEACNGRTVEEILKVLIKAVREGKVALEDKGKPIVDHRQLEQILRPQILRVIGENARVGLLA